MGCSKWQLIICVMERRNVLLTKHQVFAAVSIAPANIVPSKDKRIWEEVNVWLSNRR